MQSSRVAMYEIMVSGLIPPKSGMRYEIHLKKHSNSYINPAFYSLKNYINVLIGLVQILYLHIMDYGSTSAKNNFEIFLFLEKAVHRIKMMRTVCRFEHYNYNYTI
jgi:Na+-transporting NADH:ubiquinone oxidoreductase subunit NqrE